MEKNKTLKIFLNNPAIILSMMICLVYIIDILTGRLLTINLSLIPRETSHLIGIITAPFLHNNLSHLVSNIIPFIILSVAIQISLSNKKMYAIFWSITIISGILLWLFGRTAMHVGVSGVIFGMFSFLIILAIKRRKIIDLIIGFLIIFYFGVAILTGLLPKENISFEGHIFGLIAGIIVSLIYIYFEKNNNEEKNTKKG